MPRKTKHKKRHDDTRGDSGKKDCPSHAKKSKRDDCVKPQDAEVFIVDMHSSDADTHQGDLQTSGKDDSWQKLPKEESRKQPRQERNLKYKQLKRNKSDDDALRTSDRKEENAGRTRSETEESFRKPEIESRDSTSRYRSKTSSGGDADGERSPPSRRGQSSPRSDSDTGGRKGEQRNTSKDVDSSCLNQDASNRRTPPSRGQSSRRDAGDSRFQGGRNSPWNQSNRREVSEADLSGLRFYETDRPNQCLAVLQYPTEFHFYGKVSAEVIQGCVEILGYRISPGESFPVFSPCSTSAMVMRAVKSSSDVPLEKLRETLQSVFADSGLAKNVDRVMDQCKKHTAVVLLKAVECNAVDYVTSFEYYHDLFDRGTTPFRNNTAANLQVASSIGLHVLTEVGNRTMDISWDMRRVTESVLKHPAQPPVILVCGGKNVGKSTFCRYLINSFLDKQISVGFLEGDIGQTEFTPSSVISLTEVTEPLLGPPFSHVTEPKFMSFLGDLSPRDDPKRYIETFNYVFESYDRSCEKPLIVNTMGWNKGIGLCLLLDVIRLVKPTHIIQFDTRSQAKNLPVLSDEYLSENPGWCLPVEPEFESESKPELMFVNVNTDHGFSGKFKAINHRDMTLLAYLSQLQPDNSQKVPIPLHHLTPYTLPWKSVAVHVIHCDVPASQIMYALNASVVALCVADKSEMKQAHAATDQDFPLFFSKTPVCQCLGFGVVRGIDMSKKCFYIVTPVAADKLPKVNALLRGAMPIPNDILLQGNVSADRPYLTSEFSYAITGAGAIKIRKNLLRKSIQLKENK